MTATTIEVALSSDRNLIRQAGIVALSSVSLSTQPIHFTLLTPAEDAGHPDWRTVSELIQGAGSSSTLVPVTLDGSRLRLSERLTLATYFRLLLPDLLPSSVTGAIYMDCDILVGRDLAELWVSDLHGRALGAVRDGLFANWSRLGVDPRQGYFNAGVLLLDLRVIRSEGIFASALAFAHDYPEALTFSDQCALNKVLAGKWSALSRQWNYQHADFVADLRVRGLRRAVERARGTLMHFNNYDRPWLAESPHPLKAEYQAVLLDHPALDPTGKSSARTYWTKMKRTVKWRLIPWGKARSVPASADEW